MKDEVMAVQLSLHPYSFHFILHPFALLFALDLCGVAGRNLGHAKTPTAAARKRRWIGDGERE
jgi:hypothetical protein